MKNIDLEQLRLALIEQGVTNDQWGRALEILNTKKPAKYESWDELLNAMPEASEEDKRHWDRFLEERNEENAVVAAALKDLHQRRRLKNST